MKSQVPFVVMTLLAVLSSSWFMVCPDATAAEFRLALPGYTFSFPRDHFSHDEYRTEWWYYTGHLRTKAGDEYGYQVTFFRSGVPEVMGNPSRWAAKNLYLAHFAVSDIRQKAFTYFERINRAALGQAGASEKEFRVWIGDWEVSGDGTTQRLRAKEEGFAVDLKLVSQKAPVIHGKNGISQKGEGRGRASHYYSLTRLATEGTLTVRDESVPVSGMSWMDHEFGSTELNPDQVGWDWFSLQLDDGTELMLYVIRNAEGRPDTYSAGTYVEAGGRTVGLTQADFGVQVLDRWRSPRGKGLYPMKWRLKVSSIGLEVTVTPAFSNQELDTAKSTRVVYWEGAVLAEGVARDRRLTGRGYVEMTGYAEPFRKKL
ncbi:MAG TPA: lipocalin-like domain-containing protein [Candidatus Acidoferrum sp.]|nr:lipocalin-like domain-containing protein [Candidatus Acidoferrum sp.]